jgi:hypothetical protein
LKTKISNQMLGKGILWLRSLGLLINRCVPKLEQVSST